MKIAIVLKSVRQIFFDKNRPFFVEGYNMFLEGFGIAGYRSFGSELQKIGPFRKVNLFIGQNNSGKSNILLFLNSHIKKFQDSVVGNKPASFEHLDRPIIGDSSKIQVCLGMELDGKNYKALFEKYEEKFKNDIRPKKDLERLLKSNVLTNGGNIAWFTFELSRLRAGAFVLSPSFIDSVKSSQIMGPHEWAALWSTLTGSGAGNIDEHWIPQTLWIVSFINDIQIPEINLIPAIRRIGSPNPSEKGDENDYSGRDIIERLATLQHPSHTKHHLKTQFIAINEFLKQVTGNSSASLEIPVEKDMILVHMDEKILPLDSLGTGIHEVIILAAAATVLNNQILCIEEPELHLHPLLQKKLIRYLKDKTDNQYFITTHSAHLLDTPDVAIFHVRQQDRQSIVNTVSSDIEKTDICADLGYKASDLLQTNCIIWVEGPSDRIYLNHWIKSIETESELIEGLHYSIMYYGGRLLSHLTAVDDIQIGEFISLRRLNRYASILIDSDRDYARQPLNQTKTRIQDEFDQGPGFAWITKGREIENYILPDLLKDAVKKVHPSALSLRASGQYDNCLKNYITSAKGVSDNNADKVKVAQEIVKLPANLEILDLRAQVRKLVKFIHDANGLGVSNN